MSRHLFSRLAHPFNGVAAAVVATPWISNRSSTRKEELNSFNTPQRWKTSGSFSECQTRRPCVAMVGDIFIDIMAPLKRLPKWDSDVEAESVKMLPGGSALNQGRNLHALGTEVRFFGAVGNDTLGKTLLSQIAGQGFPIDNVKVFDALSSSVCIVLTGPADRAFVSCYSTTDAFTADDIKERAAALDGCTHFHIGGYFNLKGLQKPEFTTLVENCRKKNMTVSVNTQFDASGKWCGEGKHLKGFLPLVDVLFVNQAEAEKIAAALCPGSKQSMDALCKDFPNVTVVVTMGKDGCTVYRANMQSVHVPITPAKLVDTTGAGDAFVAGFLSSWLAQAAPLNTDAERKALQAACVKGHAVARVCVGREGACVEPIRACDLE